MNTANVSLNLPAAQSPQATPFAHPVQTRQTAAAVHTLNASGLLGTGREMTLSIDPSTKLPVVKIIDSNTREVLEQIPTEVVLRITSSLESQAAQNTQARKTYF